MADSYNRYIVSSGSGLTKYNITFPFLEKVDVKVTSVLTNGEILNWTRLEESAFDASFVNNQSNLSFGNYCVINENGINKIKFIPATQAGNYQLIIFRRTNEKLLSNFSNGSPIQADDLNKIVLLTKYATEEALDQPAVLFANLPLLYTKYDKTGGEIVGNISATGTISSASTITAQSFNLNGGTLTNVPNPTNASDGANKAYVDSVGGGGNGGNGGAVTITDDSITSAFLRKVVGQEAVTTATIRTGAVTSDKIDTNAVTSEKILNGAVTSEKLGLSSVTTSKILTGNVTADKLALSSVTTGKIANGAVTTEKLASNSFDGSIILNNTLALSKLLNSPFTHNAPTAGDIPNTTLTINSPISTTKSATLGNTSVGKLTEYTKLDYFPSAYLASDDTATRQFIYKENAISPNDTANPFTNFTASDLETLDGQPLIFQNLGTSTRKAGHFDYNIIVASSQSAVSANIGATTVIRLLRQDTGSTIGNANVALSDSRSVINFRSLSNILFNSISPASGNPSISLNTTTGVITINNIGSMGTRPLKYLFTLTGKAFVNDASAYMFLFPPSDSPRTRDFFGGSESPDTMQTLMFTPLTLLPFSCTSILSLTANNMAEVSVKYWLTKTGSNTAPTTRTFATVNTASALINASPFSSQLNGIINDPRVELVIQRIE